MRNNQLEIYERHIDSPKPGNNVSTDGHEPSPGAVQESGSSSLPSSGVLLSQFPS